MWLERLTANAIVATVLGSLPAFTGTVESEGRQMKQCCIKYLKIQKIPLKEKYLCEGVFIKKRKTYTQC
jgi:hypothetical protein